MINRIEFLNDHWVWPVLFSAILLLLVFGWKEWTQSGKRRLTLKLILAIVAIGCLVILALKPAFPTEGNGGSVILLTEGYSEEQLDSLKQENKRIKVVEYNPDNLISEELKSAEKVFLLGNGIKEYDLWQFETVPVDFLGGLDPQGITRIKYLQEGTIGDSLRLKGIYSKPKEGIKLILKGPGGVDLDSVSINSGKDQQFLLAADLNVAGNFLYSLVEKDSLGKFIRSDPVPVKVVEKETLKILVINSFPTFETKYLKNFLAEEGHQLVVKSQLTRGRFKYEYFNTSSIPVENFSENALEQFDLLIIDAISLRSLSGSELEALKNSSGLQGLGIFVQPDGNYFRSGGELGVFTFSIFPGNEVNSPDFPGVNLDRVSYQFEKDFALQPIHQVNKQIFSAYKLTGQGRIGTTVFSDTWELILDGKNEVYRVLWTDLIESISKRKNKVAEWEGESLTAYVNEPFDFRVKTAVAEPNVRSGMGNEISMMQDAHNPIQWKGRTWPRKEGWHSLRLDTLDSWEFYINDDKRWQAISATKTIEANRRFFQIKPTPGQGQQPLQSMESYWIFVLFLICIGGLWLEPKL